MHTYALQRSWIAIVLVTLFAILLMPVNAAGSIPDQAAAPDNAVKITEVIADKEAGTITIKGKNFLKRDTVQVFLGSDPIPLDVLTVTDTEIVVRFEDTITPGGYVLEVQTEVPTQGNEASRDEFDLNIP